MHEDVYKVGGKYWWGDLYTYKYTDTHTETHTDPCTDTHRHTHSFLSIFRTYTYIFGLSGQVGNWVQWRSK